MPPKRSVRNKSAAGNKKKRKAADAADHDGSPPKKKVYKKKYCKAENCTNQVVKGGVCVRHGAKVKVKRCSHEGCEKHAVNGGVCIRHGAKVKRCSREGCTNQAKKRGVCQRHGAPRKLCRVPDCTNQAVKGGVCGRHYIPPHQRNNNILCRVIKDGSSHYVWGPLHPQHKSEACRRHGRLKKEICMFEKCKTLAMYNGFCWRHRIRTGAPLNDRNMLCGIIEDRGNQLNVSAVVEISDNEEAADDGNESPIATRKRKANVANQTERGLSIEDNAALDEMEQDVSESKDTAHNSNYNDPEKSSADRGGGNLKDGTEEDASGIELQKEEAEGEKSVNDNEEEKEKAPDNAPVDDEDDDKGGRGHLETEGNQEDLTLTDVSKNGGVDVALANNGEEEDEGGGASEMEKDHKDNMADDDHYEFDAGFNHGDAFSESHVVPDEIVAVGPNGNEVDRDTEIQRLTAELEKERNQSEHVADKYESVKSQLQAKDDHIQSLRIDIEEMTQEMKEVNAGKADVEIQLTEAATARLRERAGREKERADKEAAYREVERLEAEKEELTEQLKEARSNFEAAETFWTARRENKKMLETEGANVELRREVSVLKSVNSALKGQAANAKLMEMRANGKAHAAMLEVLSHEREKDEVQATNEVLHGTIDELQAINEVLHGTIEELRESNEALCSNRSKFKRRRKQIRSKGMGMGVLSNLE